MTEMHANLLLIVHEGPECSRVPAALPDSTTRHKKARLLAVIGFVESDQVDGKD
jgi:hypothetical protein